MKELRCLRRQGRDESHPLGITARIGLLESPGATVVVIVPREECMSCSCPKRIIREANCSPSVLGRLCRLRYS